MGAADGLSTCFRKAEMLHLACLNQVFDRAATRALRSSRVWMKSIHAAQVARTPEDLREIEDAASKITVQGARYSEGAQRLIDR